MRNGIRNWLAILALGMAGTAFAVDDEPGFVPFPQGAVEQVSRVEDDDRRVYLGAVTEINNELRVDDEIRRRLTGLTRMIRVGRDYSVGEVADYYRSRIREKEATVLFECDGRSCGNSNVWANRVFGESNLYGRDDTQVYRVTAWPDSGNRIQLNTLYLIERGNREIHVYEQAFRLERGERLPGVELGRRRIFGPLVVPWSDPDSPGMEADEEVYDRIVELAEEHSDGTLYLMGYSPLGNGSVDRVLEQTEAAAARLRDLLEGRGISADRIQIRALGPLVQTVDASRTGRRIEVMLVREQDDE